MISLIYILIFLVIVKASPFVVITDSEANLTLISDAVRNLVVEMIAGDAITMNFCGPVSGTRHEVAVKAFVGNCSAWIIDRVAVLLLSTDVVISGVRVELATYSDSGVVGSNPDGFADPIGSALYSTVIADNATAKANAYDMVCVFSNSSLDTTQRNLTIASVLVSHHIGAETSGDSWIGIRVLQCITTSTQVMIPWVKISGLNVSIPFRQRGDWNGLGPETIWNNMWGDRILTIPNSAFVVIFAHAGYLSSEASSRRSSQLHSESLHTRPSSESLRSHPHSESSSRTRSNFFERSTSGAVIIGCSVGGAVLVVLTIALVFFIIRRRRSHRITIGIDMTPRRIESGAIGETAVAMASVATSDDPVLRRTLSGKVHISTDGISAALDDRAVCKNFSSMAVVTPEVIAAAGQIQVMSDVPVSATFNLKNISDGAMEYRVDSSDAGSAFEVIVGEITTDSAKAPVPSAELSSSALSVRDTLGCEAVVSGTLERGRSVTFVALVRAKVSTSRRPKIGIAVGTKRSKSREYAPIFAVRAFDIAVAVGPHPLVDPEEITVIREVGRGAFGTVYLASWRSQEVAVKEVAYVEGGSNGEEVKRELNHLSELRNQYVVQFYGFAVVRNRIQIITEFFRLGSIESALRRVASDRDRFDIEIPLGLRLRFACDSARGMSFLAGMSVVHRDFKPGNVLVVHTRPEEPSPCCKLTDFGSARSSVAGAEECDTMTKGIGTPVFMGPELLRGGPVITYTQKSDVFAYAVSLYNIFTAREPYADFENMIRVSEFVLQGGRMDLTLVVESTMRVLSDASIANATAAIIAGCWSQDPESRPTFEDIVKLVAPISDLVIEKHRKTSSKHGTDF